MTDALEVAIVGAGPYGLSVAAHLGRGARVYGTPMEIWRTRMAPDMQLRSAWDETSLSAPGDAGTIGMWARENGEPRHEPIEVATFLRYSDWFRGRFVDDHDPDDVAVVEPDGARLRVMTAGGAVATARRLVVAVGVTPFLHAPAPLAEALGERVSFAVEERDLGRFACQRVLVVGAGQSGLETAGVAAQEGAEVEIVARSGVRWFADREPHNPRGPVARRIYRLGYPAVGYGPPPFNRLVLYPDAFALLPRRARHALTRRLLRPGGSPWVRAAVEGRVAVTSGVVPVAVASDRALEVRLSDGTVREVDHVLLATGHRFDIDRLGFLAPELRAGICCAQGWPVLDRFFRTRDPRIQLVGYAAEGRFGPLARFVLGCRFAARRVAAAVLTG